MTYSVVELGGGGDSGGAHVSITVNPVNDAPVANNDTASVNDDERVISTCSPTTPTSTVIP